MADLKISQLTSATTPLAGTEQVPLVQSSSTKKTTVADIVGAGTSPGNFTTVNASSIATVGTSPGTWDAAFKVLQTSGGSFSTLTNDQFILVNAYYKSGTGFYSIANKPATLVSYDNTSTGNITTQTAPAAGVDAALSFTTRTILNASTGDYTLSTGNLVIGTAGKGIDFSADGQAAGMTSELLDDYEEGTWTPVYATTGTAFTSVTYAVQTGYYNKIGNKVTISARMRTSAVTIGSASGEVVISGLPFLPASSISLGTGIVGLANNWAGDYPLSVVTQANLLYLYYRTSVNGADLPVVPSDVATGASGNDLLITVTYFV